MSDLPHSDSEFQHHDRLESASPVLEKYTCNHDHDPLQTSESIEAHLADLDRRVHSLLQEVNDARENASSLLDVARSAREDGSAPERLKWAKREHERLGEEMERVGRVYRGLVEESLEIRCQVDMGDSKVMAHINVEEDTVGELRVRLEGLEAEVRRVGEVVVVVDGGEG